MNPFALAWSHLKHDRLRSLISVTGVAFAVILMFMQLGFLDSVERTATLFYEKLDFDLIVRSKDYEALNQPGTLSRTRLAQVQAISGVATVEAVSVVLGLWRDPRPGGDSEPRRNWSLLIVGVDPTVISRIFREPQEIFARDENGALNVALLSRPGTVLLDRDSWPDYGLPAQRTPGSWHELNSQAVELVGEVRLGTGFGYNGLVFTSDETWSRVTRLPRSQVSLGLIKLLPGVDRAGVIAELESIFPDNPPTNPRRLEILDREQVLKREREYWLTKTAVGQFFQVGVLVALLVSGIFVYQMMSADVQKHLPEYATFKALGYRTVFLVGIVMSQALLLAVFGFLPGLVTALGLYEFTQARTRIPIEMSLLRVLGVLTLTTISCLISGALAVLKVQLADPAELF